MNLEELKQQVVRQQLSIDESYGTIFSFIDFANVNNWFEEDAQDADGSLLPAGHKIEIDVNSLRAFSGLYSERSRMYYGNDPHNLASQRFTYLLRKVYGNRNVVTKPLQRIRHYAPKEEVGEQSGLVRYDQKGRPYLEIRKSNFDVEIAVDAMKMLPHFDTACLFSSDADFAYLSKELRSKGKRVILIKGGHITSELRDSVDVVINAQEVKRHITRINETGT